ncbi:hypothetical protein XENOCAPTIV_011428 [Xenoophorus captivus]|uniref:SH3 domain-containing protein n=1 Tax=Xenoophorus captivus TaxID=1517983 RepID=A0ABV0QD28_9TELE
MDASEENDGFSSGEDPMNSDTEDEVVKKLVSLEILAFLNLYCAVRISSLKICCFAFTLKAPGKYTVVADCEKAGPQELSVKSGDMVQLIREGEEGQWTFKRHQTSFRCEYHFKLMLPNKQ